MRLSVYHYHNTRMEISKTQLIFNYEYTEYFTRYIG